MVRLPTSHRKRVRLAWGTVAAAAVLTVVGLLIFVPNTGHSRATPIDYSKKPVVVTTPQSVVASPATRAAAARVLDRFVPSAMLRRRLDSSWGLATAHMKVGTSHADWLRGDLPVVPYPADAYRSFGVTLKYSYRGVLGYDVLILPNATKAGDTAGQQVYSCELHDVHGRWLVDFCYPRKTL